MIKPTEFVGLGMIKLTAFVGLGMIKPTGFVGLATEFVGLGVAVYQVG